LRQPGDVQRWWRERKADNLPLLLWASILTLSALQSCCVVDLPLCTKMAHAWASSGSRSDGNLWQMMARVLTLPIHCSVFALADVPVNELPVDLAQSLLPTVESDTRAMPWRIGSSLSLQNSGSDES